jgi:PHD/YefM family antitoxin component YafN of YafNO toxin-antitoxin module
MKTLELSDASRSLAEYAANLGAEGLVLTSRHRPVAALVSLKGAGRKKLPLGLNPVFMEIIRRARAEVRRGRVTSLRSLRAQLRRKPRRRARATPRG